MSEPEKNKTEVNLWPQLIGRYKDDPTWEEFDTFLAEYRQEVDRVYAESEKQMSELDEPK